MHSFFKSDAQTQRRGLLVEIFRGWWKFSGRRSVEGGVGEWGGRVGGGGGRERKGMRGGGVRGRKWKVEG